MAFPDRILPWEGGWRLYYRAGILDWNHEEDTTVLALAESSDGVVFTRPNLRLLEVKGTRANNVLQVGGYPAVPPPFRRRPAAVPRHEPRMPPGPAVQGHLCPVGECPRHGLGRWPALDADAGCPAGHAGAVRHRQHRDRKSVV